MSQLTPLASPRLYDDRSSIRPERPSGNDGDLADAAALGDLVELAARVASGHHERLGTDGWARLHHAAFSGQLAAVQLLIDAGANVEQRSDHGCVGSTPLLCAVA